MARTQAADYDQRREAIMRTAARLYARHGFLGASVSQVAAACGASKSLIYHYYPSKEDILFDVMDSHVQSLTEAAHMAERSAGDPADRLRALAAALMARYEGAGDHQKVLLNEMGNLPSARRALIVQHQRELLNIVDRMIVAVPRPLPLPSAERRALTMLFFGMLNWTHTWFDPTGPVRGADVADMAADMLVAGVRREA